SASSNPLLHEQEESHRRSLVHSSNQKPSIKTRGFFVVSVAGASPFQEPHGPATQGASYSPALRQALFPSNPVAVRSELSPTTTQPGRQQFIISLTVDLI
ncbi:unnamed protein product, partial [Linum tenue]